MTDKKTTVKTGNTVGKLLLMGATAIVTMIAMSRKKQIVDGINAGMTAAAAAAQKLADGGLQALVPDKMNGGTHAAPSGH